MNKISQISLDEMGFLKASKKLMSQLNEIVPEHNFKLMQTQKLLAKSLGYRNLHELKQLFVNPNTKINSNATYSNSTWELAGWENLTQKKKVMSAVEAWGKRDKFRVECLNKLSAYQLSNIYKLFLLMNTKGLLKTKDNNLLMVRTYVFIENLLRALVYLREGNNLLLDFDTIEEYLKLENLEKLVKNKSISDDCSKPLSLYIEQLMSDSDRLCGEPASNLSHCLKKHSDIQEQLVKVTRLLKSISENNFEIYNGVNFSKNKIDINNISSQVLKGLSESELEILAKNLETMLLEMKKKVIDSKYELTVFDIITYISNVDDERRKSQILLDFEKMFEHILH